MELEGKDLPEAMQLEIRAAAEEFAAILDDLLYTISDKKVKINSLENLVK